jgi:transposase
MVPTGDLCYREVINKFNEKYPKTTISHVTIRKLVKIFEETGSILTVKKIRKHLDENDAASGSVLHSVEENLQMLLRNRALQTEIEIIIIY